MLHRLHLDGPKCPILVKKMTQKFPKIHFCGTLPKVVHHHVLIPMRHIFLRCILHNLWAAPRTQNWAKLPQKGRNKFVGISQRFYFHVWTPKRHLFVVTVYRPLGSKFGQKCPKSIFLVALAQLFVAIMCGYPLGWVLNHQIHERNLYRLFLCSFW